MRDPFGPGAVVFAPRDIAVAEAGRAVRRGGARQLGPGLYTWDLVTPAETLIARRRWAVLAGYLPGCVLTDRSANIVRPVLTDDGDSVLFVSHPERFRTVRLPGLHIVARRGVGPVSGDTPFIAKGVYLASPARALVDNAAPLRMAAGRPPRTLSPEELTEWITALVTHSAPSTIDALVRDIKTVGEELGTPSRAETVLSLIDHARTQEQSLPFRPYVQ